MAMRTQVLDCPVDILTAQETLQIAIRAMQTRTPCQHVALNVAKLVHARHDKELQADIRQADIIGVDGAGIALALRLANGERAPRYAGADMFEDLMAMCEIYNLRPYILGAEQHVLDKAIAILRKRHPNLQFAGWRNGYFGDEQADVIADIRDAQPDCLFLAIPTPRKERFMARWRARLDVPFIMGIGGTIDVIAGKVNRAPSLWQKFGCEWLYRVLQEPGRMWKRYLYTNTIFAGLLAKAIVARLLHRGAPTQRRRGGDSPA